MVYRLPTGYIRYGVLEVHSAWMGQGAEVSAEAG
jgi:hypothetical protein